MTVKEIEFGGHLPVFQQLSNVGTHPLMHVFNYPPDGYRFVQTPVSEPSIEMNMRSKEAMIRLAGEFAGLHPCVTESDINHFIVSRDDASQLLIADDTELILYPTFPMTYGHVPWMMEIEETTPLFFPFIYNGRTGDTDLHALPAYWMMRHMILTDSCRGILTHMKCTAEALPVLFQDESLKKKVFHARLALAPSDVPDAVPARDPDTITFLFTNSWHQRDAGFFIRGGNDILAAFLILLNKHKNLRLILRTQLPEKLGAEVIARVRNHPAITVYDETLSEAEMDAIMAEADVQLIVSAHAHVVTALRAMAYGQALLVSDGWAIEEYADIGENAVLVPGRAGKCWSYDAEIGFVREKWLQMSQIDTAYVGRLVAAIDELIAEPGRIAELGRNGRKAIETRYTLENWNAGVKTALDAIS
jgi:hypothetical protein